MKSEKTVDFANLEVAFQHKSAYELKKAHLLFSVINNPFLSSFLTRLLKVMLFLRFPVKGLIKKTVFGHFCGGESIQDSRKSVEKIHSFHVKTILDYSVEGEKSEKGFEDTKNEILKIIRETETNEAIPFTVFKMTGIVSFDLMAKVQAGKALRPKEQEAYDRARKRVDEVCGAAVSRDIPIMIDAEETWIQDTIDALVLEMIEKYNHKKACVFNTYQMYRVDSLDNLKKHIQTMQEKGLYFGAKLVRGAYMEKERERAEDMGYPSPIHKTKKDTDQCFDDGVRHCIEQRERVSLVCGSHNENSNLLMAEIIDSLGLSRDDQRFWFSQLYGMSDNISFNLAKEGYNVAKYVPYGPVLSVMPYLFRRAEENTSVAGQSSRELLMIKNELKRR